ncbi:MAG: hypothetical protein ABGW99_11310 [Zunongwangia sp.]|uniref:hypothetical protein n=1 Tax=Zunongwangia TaxID=417127 RepID=UPI0030DB7E3F|tara:strand:- start:44 stop:244 length:201 start_codon:yes stop_codon:yes gene_type:complete
MKKAILFLCILGANMAFIACTDDSLADINEFNETYADGTDDDPGDGGGSTGEDGQIIPPADPPGSN